MARPFKEIDRTEFEKLCQIQCTLKEIAGFFDCSEDTIERWCKRTYEQGFKDIFEIKSAGGRTSLRRYQFELAKTNPTMAIWLGKQYLGQKDTQALEVSGSGMVQIINDIPKGGEDDAEAE